MKFVDILRHGSDDDLLDLERQQNFLESIDRGEWDLVIATPPCNTFSRAVFSKSPGPRPRRDVMWPWGFPWLKKEDRVKVDEANNLVTFSFECLRRAALATCHDWRITRGLLEHPEDLGTAARGEPASIWQLPECTSLVWLGYHRGALHQCAVAGGTTSKPTGLLTSVPELASRDEFHLGLPVFDSGPSPGGSWLQRRYDGPLPQSCGHVHGPGLLGASECGQFWASSAASYPWGMLRWLAEAIAEDFLSRWRAGRCTSSSGGSAGTMAPIIETPEPQLIKIPVRAFIDDVSNLLEEDIVYCGRSHRKLGLPKSAFANWPAADQGVQGDRERAVVSYRA